MEVCLQGHMASLQKSHGPSLPKPVPSEAHVVGLRGELGLVAHQQPRLLGQIWAMRQWERERLLPCEFLTFRGISISELEWNGKLRKYTAKTQFEIDSKG